MIWASWSNLVYANFLFQSIDKLAESRSSAKSRRHSTSVYLPMSNTNEWKAWHSLSHSNPLHRYWLPRDGNTVNPVISDPCSLTKFNALQGTVWMFTRLRRLFSYSLFFYLIFEQIHVQIVLAITSAPSKNEKYAV